VDELDLRVRNLTYHHFVEFGRGPTIHEVADEVGLSREETEASWRRLHDAHALVLERGRTEIRMASPFSAVPTAHRVRAGGRVWYANCAWDAFGICAALHVDGLVESSCPDCGEPIWIEIRDRRPVPDELLFHVLVPAAQWWDDIVFT
jgi:hypothetical protein